MKTIVNFTGHHLSSQTEKILAREFGGQIRLLTATQTYKLEDAIAPQIQEVVGQVNAHLEQEPDAILLAGLALPAALLARAYPNAAIVRLAPVDKNFARKFYPYEIIFSSGESVLLDLNNLNVEEEDDDDDLTVISERII